MSRKELLKTQSEFSIYGVFRFTAYLLASVAMYIGDLQIAGISNKTDFSRRVPTVSFTVKNKNPQRIAQKLADENIFVWHGHNYALEAIRLMGVEDSGGVIRIGPVHYNTIQEIDRTLEVLGTCL